MDVRTKKTLGLLLFLTVQVVSLAILEHHQQNDFQQSFNTAGSSWTMQTLIPVLAMWESIHTTAIVAYLKRQSACRMFVRREDGDEEDEEGDNSSEEEQEQENSESKRRKFDFFEKEKIASVLTSSSRAMQTAFAEHIQVHIESTAVNSEMDRAQRRDQSKELVSVLAELADVMTFIADKL